MRHSGVAWAFFKSRTVKNSVEGGGVKGSSPGNFLMHKSNLRASGQFHRAFWYINFKHKTLFILTFFRMESQLELLLLITE